MAITGPFIAPLPTPTGSPSDDYANKINNAIAELRAALSGGVDEGDLQLQSVLDLGGLALQGAAYLQPFSSVPGPGAVARAAYTRGATGDWYLTDGAGNEVRVTSGGALAVSSSADIYGNQQRHVVLRDFTLVSGSTGGSHNGYSIFEANTINTDVVFGPLQIRVGERLKAFRVRTNKNSTGTMSVQFYSSTDGGALSSVGTSGTSNTSGLQTIAVTLGSPATTFQDTFYYLRVTCPNVSDRLHAMSFTVDKVV